MESFFEEQAYLFSLWAEEKYNTTKDWVEDMNNFFNHPVSCNATTRCQITYYESNSCPIVIHSHGSKNCDYPCHVESCDYIYKPDLKCPRLTCKTIEMENYGLIIGLTFFFLILCIAVTTLVMFCKCRDQFNKICCFMRCSYNRAMNIAVGEVDNEAQETLEEEEEELLEDETSFGGVVPPILRNDIYSVPARRPRSNQSDNLYDEVFEPR